MHSTYQSLCVLGVDIIYGFCEFPCVLVSKYSLGAITISFLRGVHGAFLAVKIRERWVADSKTLWEAGNS